MLRSDTRVNLCPSSPPGPHFPWGQQPSTGVRISLWPGGWGWGLPPAGYSQVPCSWLPPVPSAFCSSSCMAPHLTPSGSPQTGNWGSPGPFAAAPVRQPSGPLTAHVRVVADESRAALLGAHLAPRWRSARGPRAPGAPGAVKMLPSPCPAVLWVPPRFHLGA